MILFLTESARTLRTGTVGRRLSSIAVAHQVAGYPSPIDDPLVKMTWRGVRRTHGTAQHGKDPVLTADLRRMVGTLPAFLAGIRDRCVLLLGFTTALLRSELVALDLADLSFRQ